MYSSSPISSIIEYYPYNYKSTMGKTTTLCHSSVEVSPVMYISLHFYLNVTFIIHIIYSTNDLNQYISWCHNFREINYIVIKRFHQLNSHMTVNTKLAWLSNKILRIYVYQHIKILLWTHSIFQLIYFYINHDVYSCLHTFSTWNWEGKFHHT